MTAGEPGLPAKWSRWRGATWEQRWLVLLSVWMLARVRRRIRRDGYKLTSQWARPEIDRRDLTTDPARAARLAWAVNATARVLPYEANCLTRSLWLLRVLHRKGLDACLCIGVQMEDGRFAAHAWIESAGQPVNDRPDIAQVYTPISVGDLPVQGDWV